MGIRTRYGNLFAPAVALGMAVGRIGCLLGGCCCGVETTAAWGIDFGDGLRRHPTQVYEMVFCLIAFVLLQRSIKTAAPGVLLVRYFLAYFVFRFLIEFIRLSPTVFYLSPFQWICLLGIILTGIKCRLMKSREPIAQ